MIRPCPLCDTPEGDVLHTQHFVALSGSPLPDCYDFVICPNCGFGFADTPATQETYSEFYRSFSKYGADHTDKEESLQLEQNRRDNQARIIARFLKGPKDRILDVGCSRGKLLSSIRTLGFTELYGLDPLPACIERIEELGFRAIKGELFDYPPLVDELPFDMVIISHVLEHIRDLQRVPVETAKFLGDEGLCYVEVPDASAFGRYPMVPYFYFDGEHIDHFDVPSVENLFRRGGFEPIANGEIVIRKTHYEYPAVYVVLRKGDPGLWDGRFSYTDGVRRGLSEHLEWSRRHSIDNYLEALQKSDESVVVWGAGQMTFRLLAISPLGKCNIAFFIDKDTTKQGTQLNGVSVLAPEALDEFGGTVLIASAYYSDEIADDIKRRGYKNTIVNLSELFK